MPKPRCPLRACHSTRMSGFSSTVIPRSLINGLVYIIVLLLLCEYLIYYAVLLQCSWPQLEGGEQLPSDNKPLKVAVIADPHLLGTRHGHWFDKLRREWQMYRSFQSMIWIHNPNVVFFLGDLFDEGLWANEKEFDNYVAHFHSLFATPTGTRVHVVIGNHDAGFHYSTKPKLYQRFGKAFSAPPVNVVNIDGNVFLLVSSIAMEGDGCALCASALKKLHQFSQAQKCSKEELPNATCSTVRLRLPRQTRPVLMQHFPLYRQSDVMCQGPDSAPIEEKEVPFKEKWDCLSFESSKLLLSLTNPRMIFSGHTHHGCHVLHEGGVQEWSVPSFNWRNRNDPSLMLLTMTPSNMSVSKCFLPRESTVIYMYLMGMVVPLVVFFTVKSKICYWKFHSKHR